MKGSHDDLDDLVEAFQEEIATRRMGLNKAHNSTVPIHQLPVELFTIILCDSIAMERNVMNPTGRARLLCHTATRWWDVIKDVRSLWSTIALGSGVALALKRSNGLPIDVVGLAAHQYWRAKNAEISKFLKLVGPHAHRWRSFRWVGEVGPVQDVLMPSPPELEVLDLDQPFPALKREIAYVCPPILRELRLANISIPWTSHLILPCLRQFSLTRLPIEDDPSGNQLLDFWASCPVLEEIQLADLACGPTRALPATPPVRPAPLPHEISTFPALKCVRIEQVTETLVLDLLRVIHAPNLTGMTLNTGLNGRAQDAILLRALAAEVNGNSMLQKALKNAESASGEIIVRSGSGALEVERSPESGDDPLGTNQIRICIRGSNWNTRMDKVIEALHLNSVNYLFGVYIQEEVGYSNSAMRSIDTNFLRLDRIRHIHVSHWRDGIAILQQLSTPVQGGAVERWPCPNLVKVHLNVKRFKRRWEGETCLKAVYKFHTSRPGMEIYGQVDDEDEIRYNGGLGSFLDVDLPVTTVAMVV